MHRDLIEITYIYDRGFSIAYRDYFLVFDYSQGNLKLPKKVNPIFFINSSPADGQFPQLFSSLPRTGTRYIVNQKIGQIRSAGRLVYLNKSPHKFEFLKLIHDPKRTLRIQPGRSYEQKGIHMTPFPGYGEELALLFNLYNVNFFHPGQMNIKLDKHKDQEGQLEKIEMDFIQLLKHLSNRAIDIAFAPLKPELGKKAFLIPDLMTHYLRPQILIPLAYKNQPETISNYLNHARTRKMGGTAIQVLIHPGSKVRIQA